jgi:3-hydroxybutyryl-CoA dehydrogenase
MGVGVAQNLAQTGHEVVLVDVGDEILERARSEILRNLKLASLLDAAVRKTDHSQTVARIDFTTRYERLAEVSFVIENATESWAVKQKIYSKIDRLCPENAIFAANTSAISINLLAGATQRPDRVVGMHFMNPVPQKRVVELVRSERSSEATVQAATELARQMSKKAIIVKDKPGFVSNRVLMLAINEAIFVAQDGLASAAEIDEIFVKCLAHKMGPLATADLIGLDTILRTLQVLGESYGGDKYNPCPLLIQMVDSGLLGRKSGRGFFDYGRR